MKQMLNALNISVNVHFIYVMHIYYRTLHGDFFVTEHFTR